MNNADNQAAKRVFVKVFGFTDAERHALRTAFALSTASHKTYAMWSPEAGQAAQLVFLDGDSWEASLEMANPEHDALKLIWVGSRPPAKAWQVFQRPLKWAAIVEALDGLNEAPKGLPEPGGAEAEIDFDLGFDIPPQVSNSVAPDLDIDIDLDLDADFGPATEPQPLDVVAPDEPDEPGKERSRILIVDSDTYTRLYWRAKLATAGHFLVDDAPSGEAALQLARFNIYTLVILDMDLTDVNSWTLFKVLKESTPPITHLILTGSRLTFWGMIRARFSGARGALRKPLHPGKVKQLLDGL